MREIEIKAQIYDTEVLVGRLAGSGIQLSDPIKQHDIVYGQEGVTANAPGSIWLRLRTENDSRTLFTLKQQHRGGLDSIEHETAVSDPEEMRAVIKMLGFVLYSELTKYRRTAEYNGIAICVDDVEGLGTFVEAEKMTDLDADGDSVVSELWTMLGSFGVDRANEVHVGYDVLMKRRLAEPQ